MIKTDNKDSVIAISKVVGCDMKPRGGATVWCYWAGLKEFSGW